MKCAGHSPIITAEFPKKTMPAATGPIRTAAGEETVNYLPTSLTSSLNWIIINRKLLSQCCNYPQDIADLQECMRHLLLPLTEPRSSRRMKKGRKDTKLQSLPRKPTGTCMDAGQSPRAQPPPARLVPAAFFLCPGQVAQRSRDQVNGR